MKKGLMTLLSIPVIALGLAGCNTSERYDSKTNEKYYPSSGDTVSTIIDGKEYPLIYYGNSISDSLNLTKTRKF